MSSRHAQPASSLQEMSTESVSARLDALLQKSEWGGIRESERDSNASKIETDTYGPGPATGISSSDFDQLLDKLEARVKTSKELSSIKERVQSALSEFHSSQNTAHPSLGDGEEVSGSLIRRRRIAQAGKESIGSLMTNQKRVRHRMNRAITDLHRWMEVRARSSYKIIESQKEGMDLALKTMRMTFIWMRIHSRRSKI